MKYRKEAVRVGLSRHGWGIFSLRLFVTGEFIGPIQGEIMEDPAYGSEYGIDLGDGDRTLEPAAPFRFLNPSCQPNCALVIYDEEDEDGTPRGLSVWLEILSEIAPGEQMTIDYAWIAVAAIPCQCGTASCRGWIVAEEDLDGVVSTRQDSPPRRDPRSRHSASRLDR
ncbi:MAG: SET domain-containing protein-lysine N-methyltransferase [Thermoguttaceae bacterium]